MNAMQWVNYIQRSYNERYKLTSQYYLMGVFLNNLMINMITFTSTDGVD